MKVISRAECVLLWQTYLSRRMAYDHETIPQNETFILLLDYLVEQWMENQTVPIEMCNTNKHR
jgi:hypothetical protein